MVDLRHGNFEQFGCCIAGGSRYPVELIFWMPAIRGVMNYLSSSIARMRLITYGLRYLSGRFYELLCADMGYLMVRKLWQFLLFSVILIFVNTANSEGLALHGAPTASELTMLPQYCQTRLGKGSTDYNHWPSFRPITSLHHYCWGLNNMNRYYRGAPGRAPGTWLSNAINAFDYMLNNPDLQHPLTPEIFLNRAIAYDLSGKDAAAIKDFLQALALNPRIAKTYSSLASFYDKRKLREKALETVSQGLQYLPDDKVLHRAYTKYGGKMPYPEPLAKPDIKPVVEEVSATVKGQEGASVVVESKPETPTVIPPAPPKEQSQSASGGEKKNPWCRFCPE